MACADYQHGAGGGRIMVAHRPVPIAATVAEHHYFDCVRECPHDDRTILALSAAAATPTLWLVCLLFGGTSNVFGITVTTGGGVGDVGGVCGDNVKLIQLLGKHGSAGGW